MPNEIKILDLIPESLRTQLIKEVLEEVKKDEEKKKTEVSQVMQDYLKDKKTKKS